MITYESCYADFDFYTKRSQMRVYKRNFKISLHYKETVSISYSYIQQYSELIGFVENYYKFCGR